MKELIIAAIVALIVGFTAGFFIGPSSIEIVDGCPICEECI